MPKPRLTEQMPGMLARLDDPWGITWRVANVFRRFSVRQTMRFIAAFARGVDYERPIFVIGAPRSGTTMLFRLLRESEELASMPHEGHDMWRFFHHPRHCGWRSDAVKLGEMHSAERRFINAFVYSHARSTAHRFLEKTPENALRIPYLLELFPDATFLIVKRNPCDVINSLIMGWQHPAGRFRSYFVPQDLSIPGYPHHRQWCFALIEGWRDLKSSPIPEIAFAQWYQCSRAIKDARALVVPAKWIEVYFEDLLQNPGNILPRICVGAGIQNEPALRNKLTELIANPVNALSAPGSNKWKTQRVREISGLMGRIAPAAGEFGYAIDTRSGDFEMMR